MPQVRFGRKDEAPTQLAQSDALIAVRTDRPIARRGAPVRGALESALPDRALVASFPEANVGVYRLPDQTADAVEAAKQQLQMMPGVRFAGRALVDSAGKPVVYTENIFLKFRDDLSEDHCRAVIAEHGLALKRVLDYAPNAYFVAADGVGQAVFEIAARLLDRDDVEYCHPEVVRKRAKKQVYAQQWHLAATEIGGIAIDADANVTAAHALSTGQGTTIAIIDDGVDIDHPEFAGKIVHPRDETFDSDDPRPKDLHPLYPDNHGTACAGVACAKGVGGALGVAPDAKLMPIRLASALGSQDEADAFVWAARNGADVVSCSWGPPDGAWNSPQDPAHTDPWPMPAITRVAIDYAVQEGRGGKGCIVLFAAGNGNEDVSFDGYASHPDVIAVAACNDRGVRSCYSDYGDAVWCAFPSNDLADPANGRPAPLTPGIWTTDRLGMKGYNFGSDISGDPAGNYANDFGGTSSACPGVAGVVALMLSVRPDLDQDNVRAILRDSCEAIDAANGRYGDDGHSPYYGFGRVDAHAAVQGALALPTPAIN